MSLFRFSSARDKISTSISALIQTLEDERDALQDEQDENERAAEDWDEEEEGVEFETIDNSKEIEELDEAIQLLENAQGSVDGINMERKN